MPYSNRTPINLQSIIDAMDNDFVVIDKNYNIVAANEAYCRAYNIDSTEIVGHKCHVVSHHSDVPCHLNGEDCPHKKVFETKKPHQVLHIHYDQNNEEEHVRIKGAPVYGTDGELFLGEAVFPITRSDDLDCDKQRMLGTSPSFLTCVEEMAGAANSNAPILLQGESGVGKQLAANFIHNKSERRANAFVSIDCASISEGVFESELFGHERGAFTGCIGRRLGLIDSANNGTLFMDEIGEIPLELQGCLLRALETGYYRRIGGREDMHVDVRVICATHDNLSEMVAEGTFRADLYYRISGMTINIPPLRERRSDLTALVQSILKRIHSQNGSVGSVSKDAMDQLMSYDYPGNIRELQNILQKAVAVSTSGLITADLLKFNDYSTSFNYCRFNTSQETIAHIPNINRSLTDLEATHIESLLHQYHGHRAKVAEQLCISERTLYRKLKQYKLQHVGKNKMQ